MKECPFCRSNNLAQVFLEQDLPAYKCSSCGGAWLRSNEYQIWLRGREATQPTRLQWAGEGAPPTLITDSDDAKLCPDCGRLLRRYKIWPEAEHHLERCATCNGVWFDRQEWEALKQKNLHNKIHLIFTKHWQQRLRQEETRRRFEKMYAERFGEKDYDAIKKIRHWLDEHPQRSGLMAYLLDDNPYSG